VAQPGETMGRISPAARNNCLRKADEVTTGIARYVRNGGWKDIRDGDVSRLQTAYNQLALLRLTALTEAEHESYKKKIWSALKLVKQDLKSMPNLISAVAAADWQRRMGLGHVNRPRISHF
jgi:hypothetical protein